MHELNLLKLYISQCFEAIIYIPWLKFHTDKKKKKKKRETTDVYFTHQSFLFFFFSFFFFCWQILNHNIGSNHLTTIKIPERNSFCHSFKQIWFLLFLFSFILLKVPSFFFVFFLFYLFLFYFLFMTRQGLVSNFTFLVLRSCFRPIHLPNFCVCVCVCVICIDSIKLRKRRLLIDDAIYRSLSIATDDNEKHFGVKWREWEDVVGECRDRGSISCLLSLITSCRWDLE